MLNPLVSIVMPSFNQAKFLPSAIDSVLSQTYQNVELIVMDGGSSDGSLEVLDEISIGDRRIRYFSEPDGGPANALNKALAKARGTIIGWLNSDDIYEHSAISRAVKAILSDNRMLMVYGEAQHIDEHGKSLGLYPTLDPSISLSAFSNGCFICQPSVFFRRTMNVLLGPIDESLMTAFDFEYWMRAFSSFPERIGFIPAVQAYSRLHSDCITKRFRRVVALEGILVIHRHLGVAPVHWVLTYFREQYGQEAFEQCSDVFLQDAKDILNRISDCVSEHDLFRLRRKLELIQAHAD